MDVSTAVVEAVSTFGTVMVFFMLSAQLPAMYQVIFKTKSVANISAVPTVGQLSNFLTWTIYAIYKGDGPLLRVNALGIGFGCGYLLIFLYYATGRSRVVLYQLLAALAIAVAALETPFILATSGDLRLTLMGSFSVACNVAMYAAPIAQLRVAFASMNPTALPLLLCFANTVTSGTWMMYGLFMGNWFVAGPNVAGCALNIVQLLAGGYINVRARLDPSIVKPLPGQDKEDGQDEADEAGLLAGLREDEDPLTAGSATRYTAMS